MDLKPQQPKGKDVLASLNAAIDAMDVAMLSTAAPAMGVYGSVYNLLTVIRVCFLHSSDEKSQFHV